MVWSTTASSSVLRVSRLIWARRRVKNAWDGLGGVVLAAVEAPIHHLLDAAARRLEQVVPATPSSADPFLSAEDLPHDQDGAGVDATKQDSEQLIDQGAVSQPMALLGR
jgi:hypothetical protein